MKTSEKAGPTQAQIAAWLGSRQGDVSRALSAGRGPTCAGAEVVMAVWPELDGAARERVERRLAIMRAAEKSA